MIIYIADLSHTGMGRSPNSIPLAAGYLAATAKKQFPDIDIRLFREPDELLQAARLKQPNIIGFSVHVWSGRLSAFCAQRVKDISKEIVIVAGGPSVDEIDSELLRYMRLHSYYDICIPNEGEVSFIRLIEHVGTHGRVVPDEIIEGCAALASDGSLLRGAYTMPNLSEIPSPYLGGFLDKFLYEGYDPVIQSMRGCPYSCKFCVSGSSSWSNIRAFDLERVFEEFEYIVDRTRSEMLIFSDENFGILKKRDLELAKFIIKSFNENDYPRRMRFCTAKIVTDYVQKIIEILSPISRFAMSFQTLNEKVKNDVKRTNITFDQFIENILWAKERKILTTTEMIFGFPGETVNSYISGIEQLLCSGVDRIYSYNLHFLPGADLGREANRNKYNYKTRYRLGDRTYGSYDGTSVTEVEEIVIESDSFNYNDYLQIRKYGLFLEFSSGRGYLSLLIQLMIKLSLPGEKLIQFLSEHEFVQYPQLRSVINKYIYRAENEIFETPDECVEYASQLIAHGKSVPQVKLNLIYTGKIFLDSRTRGELFEVIKEFISIHSNTAKVIEFFSDYINNILAKQVVSFRSNEKTVVQQKTKVHLDKIERNDYNSVDELLSGNLLSLDLRLHDDAINFIRTSPLSDIDDEERLQNIYLSVSKFGLLRQSTRLSSSVGTVKENNDSGH